MCLDLAILCTDGADGPAATFYQTFHHPDAAMALAMALDMAEESGLVPVQLLSCTVHRHLNDKHGVH